MIFLFIKCQKEANFSKDVNIIADNKPLLYFNNNCNLNNRETKLNGGKSEIAFDNKKESTFISTNNNLNNSSNNYIEYAKLRNLSLISIDDKYKNLENPFTSPKLDKNADEERRSKIIERINKNRINKYKSLSVDNVRNKKNENIQKRADYLGNQIFGDENEDYNLI